MFYIWATWIWMKSRDVVKKSLSVHVSCAHLRCMQSYKIIVSCVRTRFFNILKLYTCKEIKSTCLHFFSSLYFVLMTSSWWLVTLFLESFFLFFFELHPLLKKKMLTMNFSIFSLIDICFPAVPHIFHFFTFSFHATFSFYR